MCGQRRAGYKPGTMNTLLAQSSNGGGAAAAGFGLCWLLGAGIALAITAFTIWMLVDVLSGNKPTNEKLLWALVIIFTGGLGAIIYFVVARGK